MSYPKSRAKSFTVKINTANAAFENSRNDELARILRNLAADVEAGYVPENLQDINGNTVGTVQS